MKCHSWLKQCTLCLTLAASSWLSTPGLAADLLLEPILSFTSSINGNAVFKDGYGSTVCMNEDWVFVAAPVARPDPAKLIEGAVYVYKKVCGSYEQQQIITTSGQSDHLGFLQMESKGDWLLVSLVGTPAGPVNPDGLINQNFTGSVQIYHLENGQWVWHSALDRNTPGLEELSVIDPQALNPLVLPTLFEQGANFGLSFSLNWHHRVLLVGAQYQSGSPNNDLINAGAVYAFHYDDQQHQWVLAQTLTNPDGVSKNDVFGSCVATNGHIALISNAPIFQLPKTTSSAVYVFEKTRCNKWVFKQKIVGDQIDTTPLTLNLAGGQIIPTGDCFGNTIAIKGKHVIIGAPQENLGTTTIRGAAYFYHLKKCGKLKRVFKATSEDVTAQRFGFPTIRIHDDKAYISDTNFTGNAGKSQGAIAVYKFSKGEWKSCGNLVNPTAIPFEFFGESFDLAVNRIGIGSGLFNSGFSSVASGAPPFAIPLPYYAKTPFTIYKIKKPCKPLGDN